MSSPLVRSTAIPLGFSPSTYPVSDRTIFQLEVNGKGVSKQNGNIKEDVKEENKKRAFLTKLLNNTENPLDRKELESLEVLRKLAQNATLTKTLEENPQLANVFNKYYNPKRSELQKDDFNSRISKLNFSIKFPDELNKILQDEKQPNPGNPDTNQILTVLNTLREELHATRDQHSREHQALSIQQGVLLSGVVLMLSKDKISNFQKSNNTVSDFINNNSGRLPNNLDNKANLASSILEKLVSVAGHLGPVRSLLHLNSDNKPVKKGELYTLLVHCYNRVLLELDGVDLQKEMQPEKLSKVTAALTAFNSFHDTALSGNLNKLSLNGTMNQAMSLTNTSLKKRENLNAFMNSMIAFISCKDPRSFMPEQHYSGN